MQNYTAKIKRHTDSTGGTAMSNAAYGMGSDPIWLDEVGCTGTELLLTDCTNNGFGTHNCGHSEDAGVMCSGPITPPRKFNTLTMHRLRYRLYKLYYTAFCIQGDIRLVGGADFRQGRIEVCNDNAWGTVCDDFFGSEEAAVACRQLGLNGDGKCLVLAGLSTLINFNCYDMQVPLLSAALDMDKELAKLS